MALATGSEDDCFHPRRAVAAEREATAITVSVEPRPAAVMGMERTLNDALLAQFGQDGISSPVNKLKCRVQQWLLASSSYLRTHPLAFGNCVRGWAKSTCLTASKYDVCCARLQSVILHLYAWAGGQRSNHNQTLGCEV